MTAILVATESGCRVIRESGKEILELVGRKVGALAPEPEGACVAVVDDQEIWRRSADGTWSKLTRVGIGLQSILSSHGTLYCGGMEEATIFRIPQSGEPARLSGFDHVSGRGDWYAVGPPLGVRALTATVDGNALLAAVHVGGVPRSEDGGATWIPTMPLMFDVHEVRAHPLLPDFVAAATAIGLCVSQDGGRNWEVFADGLELKNSLAVAFFEQEILFSVQDGPWAKRSQVWRWRIGSRELEAVRDGLPEWFEGKVDTNQIAAGGGRGAIVDGGGNVWLSQAGSCGWKCVASGLPYAFGVVVANVL
jgi:hypothetical protein